MHEQHSRDASVSTSTHATRRLGEGRTRILIEVPVEGDPTIRMLDEAGNDALRLPS